MLSVLNGFAITIHSSCARHYGLLYLVRMETIGKYQWCISRSTSLVHTQTPLPNENQASVQLNIPVGKFGASVGLFSSNVDGLL